MEIVVSKLAECFHVSKGVVGKQESIPFSVQLVQSKETAML